MKRFASEQVHPFLYRLTEPESPLQVIARRDGEVFRFEVDLPEWKFLEPLMGADPAVRKVEQSDLVDFWTRVLDYGPQDQIEFVEVEGSACLLPLDLFDCWIDNTRYEYEIWSRARQEYEKWIALGEALSEELPEPVDWSTEIPEQKALRSLEYELSLSALNRPYLLKRLYALGLLEENDCLVPALNQAGCPRLLRWHRAALQLRWVGRFVDGMLCGPNILASPVGLEWFVDGPFLQKRLDPLHHLKFAVHHHIKRAPPRVSSSFIVSMGGLISGAFFYQLGMGEVPQLVRGGEPPPGSLLRELYAYELTPGSDRFCELSARAIRAGFCRWGGRLAWSSMESDPEHGQSWIEVGVALHALGNPGEAKACLQKARECGYTFSETGELAGIWQSECGELPDSCAAFQGWEAELEELPDEELTAVAMAGEVTTVAEFGTALDRLSGKRAFLSYFLPLPEGDLPSTAHPHAR